MKRTCKSACAILFLGFFLPAGIAFADGENPLVGARAAGMAYAATTLTDVWSNFFNQAALGNLDKAAFGLHHENAFMVKELALKAAALAIPANFGTFGMNASYFGYSRFHRLKTGLAFGRKLGKRISAGIQLDYFSEFTSDQNRSVHCFTFEGGLLAELPGELSFGVHLFNPANIGYYGRVSGTLSPVTRVGLGFHRVAGLILAAEAEKSLRSAPVFRFGAEYAIKHFLFLRTGISTNPLLNTFGLGLNCKNVRLDIAFSRHTALGYTPYLSLGYTF